MSEQILLEKATKNIRQILSEALMLTQEETALVVYDTETRLSRVLTEAYRRAAPDGVFIDFNEAGDAGVKAAIAERQAGDLVALIQSTNFRLNEFRIRIELFKHELKTIEHMHLNRMTEEQEERYIDTLAYDPNYYRPLGHALKRRLDEAEEVIVECENTILTFASKMKSAKLNIGDYSEMQHVGGTFPIGEVFTEAEDLTAINGEAKIFAFAGLDLLAREYPPFLVRIQNGILEAGEDVPEEFLRVLDLIREDEPAVVREFGLGLNPAIGKGRPLDDMTAFERMKGLHVSLGAKHGIYKEIAKKRGRYHIDVFVDMKRILVDGKPLFENGDFTEGS